MMALPEHKRSTEVSRFQIHHHLAGLVDQAVAVARPGLKAGAHARRQRAVAFVGVQRFNRREPVLLLKNLPVIFNSIKPYSRIVRHAA